MLPTTWTVMMLNYADDAEGEDDLPTATATLISIASASATATAAAAAAAAVATAAASPAASATATISTSCYHSCWQCYYCHHHQPYNRIVSGAAFEQNPRPSGKVTFAVLVSMQDIQTGDDHEAGGS